MDAIIASIRAALAVLALRLQQQDTAAQEAAAAASQAAQTAQAAAEAAQADASAADTRARERWTHVGGQASNTSTGMTGNIVLHTDGLATLSDGTVWPDDVEILGFQYLVTAASGAPWTGHGGDTFAEWHVYVGNSLTEQVPVPLDGGNPDASGYLAFDGPVAVPAGSRFTLQWRPGDMGGAPATLRATLVVRVP